MYKTNKKNQLLLDSRKSFFLLLGIFCIYFLLSSAALNEKLSAPGEMWILYVADRITDGLLPYQDITITYGAITYFFNAILLEAGLDHSNLKLIMLMVSISNGILIYFATKKIFKNNPISILSVAIYMFIPMHYGHGPSIHPDQLAVMQSLLIFNLILTKKRSSYLVGGFIGSLIYLTKIIAIPLSIAPIIHSILNRDKKGVLYVISLAIFSAVGYISILSIKNYDLSRFFYDYILANPDTPFEHLRSYVWIEGFVALLGVIGLIVYIKKNSIRDLLPIMSLLSILPFFAFMIRGTGIYSANYIEPFIAILASYFIFSVYNKIKETRSVKIAQITVIILITIIFVQFAIFDYPNRERHSDWQGERGFKTLNENTQVHSKLINEFTKENDVVVAIPMSAFQTNRILALDESPYSDILKLRNELGHKEAQDTIENMKEMVETKKIRIILDGNYTRNTEIERLRDQLLFFYPFDLPEIKNAIDENYELHDFNGYRFYLPKIDGEK